MTNVLIVEDHVSMRESLTTALTAAGDFSVVGEVPNADYALDFCKHLHPELVLMDVCTEGGASGLKAVEAIRKTDPEVKIIVMTAFDEITYIPRARAAGANGFVYKSRSLHDFLEVARTVMAGGQQLPRAQDHSHAPGRGSPHRPGDGGTPADVQTHDQQRDRPGAVYQRKHRQVSQDEHAGQDRLFQGGGSGLLHDLQRLDQSPVLKNCTSYPPALCRWIFCFREKTTRSG